MDCSVNDLAAFILARIAEDEAVAAEAGGDSWEVADARKVRWVRNGGAAHGWAAFVDLPTATAHIARHDPARVLAECEAKRRIVEFYGGPRGQTYALRFLALPFADHPDYRDEWRP